MSGGAFEYVMGGMYADATKTKLISESSGFTETELTLNSSEFIGAKYIDMYDYGTSYTDFSRIKLGDATGETRGWYSDYTDFVASDYPWFLRGGSHSIGTVAGVFCSGSGNGISSSNYGFRLAVSGVIPSA